MYIRHKQCNKRLPFHIGLILITLFMFFGCKGYKYIQLNVSREGELAERIGQYSNSVTDLCISGKLNESDIQQLIELATGSDLLTRIDLSNCDIELPHHAFAGCSLLRSISLPAQNTKTVNNHTFSGCSSLENIVIPENCATIETQAFGNCTSLKEIVLPESMETIAPDAFKNCNNLSIIRCFATIPPNCSGTTFTEVNPNCLLIVPKGSGSLYKNAIGWERIKSIEETKNTQYVGPTHWGKN